MEGKSIGNVAAVARRTWANVKDLCLGRRANAKRMRNGRKKKSSGEGKGRPKGRRKKMVGDVFKTNT